MLFILYRADIIIIIFIIIIIIIIIITSNLLRAANVNHIGESEARFSRS